VYIQNSVIERHHGVQSVLLLLLAVLPLRLSAQAGADPAYHRPHAHTLPIQATAVAAPVAVPPRQGTR
jgi:hypothetical protein